MNKLKVCSWLVLIIFVWWILGAFLLGIGTIPNEGDSLTIHIPAAKRILEGTIFNLDYTKDLFYPYSIELILALFILLKIPLGLFNVFGVALLFLGSYLAGKEILRDKYYSIIFAVSIALMHGVIRWSLTQKPDILMLAALSFIFWIVFKKSRNAFDYFLLGLFSGLFVGAKFNSPVFLIVILAPFYKKFINEFGWKKFISFLVPFFSIGLSWYIRNIIIAGDPFYFPDYIHMSQNFSISNYTLYGYLFQPFQMINAYISEFMIWGAGFIIVPFFIYKKWKDISEKNNALILKFFGSAFVLLLISFAFPYRALLHQMVGTSRYILPAIFLIVICVFLIFQKVKKEILLTLTAIPVLVLSQMNNYHPKVAFPIIFVIWILYFSKDRVRRFLFRTKLSNIK